MALAVVWASLCESAQHAQRRNEETCRFVKRGAAAVVDVNSELDNIRWLILSLRECREQEWMNQKNRLCTTHDFEMLQCE